MAQQILSTNTFTTAKWIVSATASDGTHTTVASAITRASSGDTIFIRPGTYSVGSLTLKAGVNLTAFSTDDSLDGTGCVILSGNCILNTAGSVTLSGIQFQGSSSSAISVTGSAASILNLNNCYIVGNSGSAITFSCANTGALLNVYNSNGNLTTTGVSIFAHSSTGFLYFRNCIFNNSGASTTANTLSAGVLSMDYCTFTNPITTSGSTAVMSINQSLVKTDTQNVTSLTHGCTNATSSSAQYSTFSAGSASAVSISASCTLGLNKVNIGSSNTNAITGSGTINYSDLSYTSTSITNNVTTQVGGTLTGSRNTAPSAGFLGEEIRATLAIGSATSLATGTAKTVTSISLTAGVWSVSAIGTFISGGATASTSFGVSISPTNNTMGANTGDDSGYFNVNLTNFAPTISVPSYRVTISSTTKYYLVVVSSFSVSTMTAYGRISAVRVA